MASKGYLITFGNDLMLASDCISEESYCEWPLSYESRPDCCNDWLAGDFEFLVEHIEVYEISLS